MTDTSAAALAEQVRRIDEGCVECGLCAKNCLFLRKHGLPKTIARRMRKPDRDPALAYECSLCGLCTAVCPRETDPAALFFAMRRRAVAVGRGEYRQHRMLLGYERRGVSPLFSCYSLPRGCDTVFFPGCAMAGSRSGRVLQLYQYLRKQVPGLGMVLDCCTKPSHDLARLDYFHAMFGAMREALFRKGVRRILVTCPSCYRVWQDYGHGFEVETVYQLLACGEPVRQVAAPGSVTVHDPCPTRNAEEVHAAVRMLIRSMGYGLEEMKHHGRTTFCCGEGGAACYLVPEFSGNWTRSRTGEAGALPIITYCAGCTHFLGRLHRTVHLTDLFFEPEKALAARVRVARSPMTWLHRYLLKRRVSRQDKTGVAGCRDATGSIIFHSKPA